MLRSIFSRENDLGMEEGSSYAGGDGDQLFLPIEDFDQRSAGEFWKVDGASAADAGGDFVVGSDGRNMGKQFPVVKQQFLGAILPGCGVEAFEGMRGGDGEFRNLDPAQRFKMCAAAEKASHIVGDGTHVGAAADAGTEGSTVIADMQDGEFLDFHLHRLEFHGLLFTGEFVSRNAVNFFGGKGRRSLLEDSTEACRDFPNLIGRERDWLGWGGGFSLRIVGVGGEAEADNAFVGLLGFCVELGEASEVSEDQGKHAGGERIEGPEVSYRALLENAADAVNDIVRSETSGLVDDQDGIHRLNWLSKASGLVSWPVGSGDACVYTLKLSNSFIAQS